ncbi:MAG: hypothetical protein ACI8P0_001991 [Planctomycetaceae bacterium]|jgi:hypothetical protein
MLLSAFFLSESLPLCVENQHWVERISNIDL